MKISSMWLRKLFILLVLIAISLALTKAETSETPQAPKICQSFEITSLEGFEQLRSCKIIVGHVRLINLELTPTTAIPASVVEEITDYLIVYRVHGLNTLQRIFPRLKLIRGQELLFGKYALVVLENRELENLGLISLLRIQKGNVRIENNPVLCFVDTVNWVYILGNKTKQDISFKNKPSSQCPLCNETFADIDLNRNDENLRKHCWNLDAYQRNTIYGSLNCTRPCGIYGCNAHCCDCCSANCLTSCAVQNCELCANFQVWNGCADICPFSYFLHNKRECIPQKSCLSQGMIPFSGTCLSACPKHYIKANDTCINPCEGDYLIREPADLEALVDCKFIRGSLTIELREIKAKVISELERALGEIKEITNFLKVKNSPQLTSLQFLSNLHTIKGEQLINGKYALYVVDNYHLEQIWNQNQNVAILKGRIYFHLNPKLCYDKIIKLANSVKSIQKIEAPDVSPNSNGERVVCGENVHILNATVEDLNSTAVRIKVNPQTADDMNLLIGYAHFYKEAPIRNVSWYDGRHGCGHDDWLMDISPNRYVRHVIRHLKPNTQYAYFVKTLTMTEYHIQLDAYSKIQYFRTLSSKPGPVAKVYYHTISATELMIHWWPPLSPNGNIAYYLLNHTISESKSTANDKENYLLSLPANKTHDLCQCKLKDAFSSGPLPADENYYSKEQITYDEALANFIFVSRLTLAKDEKAKENQETAKNATNQTENIKPFSVCKTIPTKIVTNATKLTKDQEAEIRFQNMRREQEKKALELQNANLTDFEIIKPLPICQAGNVSDACRLIEHFEGTHVPGHIHEFLLYNIDPKIIYNITVRACLESGECGAATFVLAQTFSKTIEEFANSTEDLTNDIDE